jgi:AraC-like DNA-binding protein
MRYAEYLPGPEFASIVERFWLLEGTAAGAPDAIIPDGRVELVFHYGGTFWRHQPGGRPVRQPSSLLVGQMVEPVVLAPQGEAGVAAIRLMPAAAGTFLGFCAREIAGRFVELDAVCAPTGELRERLAEAGGDAARIEILEAWLRRMVRRATRPQMDAAVSVIVRSGGRASVDRIAARTGLGVRQIERHFHDQVGLGPKTFSRIVRLQAALARIRQGGPLCDVAVACGYYDQAHMARDFRQLAAMSPVVWQAHSGELAPLFISSSS